MKRNSRQSKKVASTVEETKETEEPSATMCGDLGAGFYWVEIIHRGEMTCRSRVRAHSSHQALEICRARHQNAALIRLVEEN